MKTFSIQLSTVAKIRLQYTKSAKDTKYIKYSNCTEYIKYTELSDLKKKHNSG